MSRRGRAALVLLVYTAGVFLFVHFGFRRSADQWSTSPHPFLHTLEQFRGTLQDSLRQYGQLLTGLLLGNIVLWIGVHRLVNRMSGYRLVLLPLITLLLTGILFGLFTGIPGLHPERWSERSQFYALTTVHVGVCTALVFGFAVDRKLRGASTAVVR